MKDKQVVIITGLSGSGKSTAIKSLEDFVGCSGGKHRSVAIAEEVGKRIACGR